MASFESHLEAANLFSIAGGGLFPTSLNASAADSRAAFLYDSTDDDVVVINANDGLDDETFESNIDELVSGDGFYAFTSTIETPIGGGGGGVGGVGNRSLQDVLATVITAATATSSTTTTTTTTSTSWRPQLPVWLIVCYSVILLCAIIGNLLVISTLVQNRRMRTITNFFLLNLAISDILLGVLCMPVTLAGALLRNFIFGEVMCKLIAFSQAASVAVSSWTLVAISCERYYAICHPLRSRTWQTINHAYKIIGFIWVGSIVCMLPIAVVSKLIPTSQGLRKCREVWPEEFLVYERTYNIFLDLALLVLPLMILCIAYILITRTLYIGMKQERAMIFGNSSRDSYKFNGCQTEVATLTMGGAGGKGAITTTAATAAATTNGTSTLSMAGSGSNSQFSLNTSFRLRDMRPGGRNSFGKSDSGYGSVSGASSASANMKINPDMEIVCSQQQQQQCGSAATGGHRKQYYDEYVYPSSNSHKRKMLSSSSTDGRRHLYCMRSASIKSLNRPGHPVGAAGAGATSSTTTTTTTMTHTPSMTVINMPQQQRFKLNLQRHHNALQQQLQFDSSLDRRKSRGNSMRITEAALRRSNMTKNLESKKRVVKMLFVLVLEFFVCWTPLYVFHTLTVFAGPVIYEYFDSKTISFLQLLAYSSSCCNPITYCFMNAGFRRAFLDTFRSVQWQNFWRKRYKSETNLCVAGNSLNMANSVTMMTNNTVLDSPRL